MSDPPAGRSMSGVVRVSIRRPWLTIAACLGLALAGGLFTARALTFQTSSVQLLPPHHLYVQRFKDYLRDFGELNDIVIVIEAPSVPRAQAYADRLATEIRRLPGAGRIAYRVDPELFSGQALLYLSSEKLEDLADKIRLHRRFIERYAARPSLAELFDAIAEEIARRLALGFVDLDLDSGPKEKLDAGFVDTLLGVVGERLDGAGAEASPWGRVFTSAAEQERSGYFFSADDRLLFLLVEPRREAANFTDNEQFVAAIRRAIQALRATFPDVAAGATGTPALSNDEMLTAFRDSKWATLLAAVLTVGSLVLVMRRAVEPLVLLAVLLVSLAWSLGIITATVGHLTVFSVMFMSLLIGIGIDYGVYICLRYEEELGLGRAPAEALAVTAGRSGPGILFGALTAAGTFGVLMLTEFRGIQEFGFIAGVAILMAFVSMLTLLPAVLVLLRRHRAPAAGGQDEVRLLRRLGRHPVPILVVAAALTGGALLALPAVRFDYNRLNLQAKGTESVIWERKIAESRRSGFAALASADSLAELKAKQDAFAALPAVSEVTSVLKLIPAEQDAKIAAVRRLAPLVAEVRFRPAPPADPAAVRRALIGLRHRLQIAVTEAEGQASIDALRSAHERAGVLLARLERPDAGLRERLAGAQASLRDDFAAKLRRLQDNLSPRPVTLRELPPEVTRKFVGASGRLLMLIYPAIDTWERDGAREFVRQLRTVDAAVTGSPVISYEASRLVETAYLQGTLYAALLVSVLAGLMLRRPLHVGLALVPLALGTLWTIGVMRVFGLSFTLANVWGLPLIIGASAEYGFMVVLRWRERIGAGGVRLPRSAVLGVVLNGLTTTAGFGSLMVARHQGIFGLGLLLTIGTGAALASSLVLLPVLLRLTERGVTGKEP
ncbi:MAG TPA: MMPL family transporter [Candidatus Binatia bacterium]|nr:MMPL family transporter [Candidatus Binatia bacterium]